MVIEECHLGCRGGIRRKDPWLQRRTWAGACMSSYSDVPRLSKLDIILQMSDRYVGAE